MGAREQISPWAPNSGISPSNNKVKPGTPKTIRMTPVHSVCTFCSVLPILLLCTTSQRKSLSFPRRRTRRRTRRSPLSRPSGSVLPVLHLYYNSTKIPPLPAPPYGSCAPQSALAPLRLCPPSTTFVLQFNENPSASRTAVRAAVRNTFNENPSRLRFHIVFIPASLSSPFRFHPAGGTLFLFRSVSL